MAINLRFYTKINKDDLQEKLDALREKYSYIFPEHYVLYNAREVDELDKEISNEFGLDPKSSFMIAVNNKELIIGTSDIANLLRKEMSGDDIIVLFNGEMLI